MQGTLYQSFYGSVILIVLSYMLLIQHIHLCSVAKYCISYYGSYNLYCIIKSLSGTFDVT